MKVMNKLVALLASVAMFSCFSGSAFAEIVVEEQDVLIKISDNLLAKYGTNRDYLESVSLERSIDEVGNEKLPVIVWIAEDVDYKAIEKEALPVLLGDISASNKNSPLLSKSELCLDDVLNSKEKLSADAVQKFIETKRTIASNIYKEYNTQFSDKYLSDYEIKYVSEYSPAVVAELSLSDVVELATLEETVMFEYNVKECEDQMDVSLPVVKADVQDVTYGYTGNGVKIGQVETFAVDRYHSCFSSASNRITVYPSSSPALISSSSHGNNHANAVASIIIGNQGIASGATYYSVSLSGTSGILEAIEWLVGQGVNVINMSMSYLSDYNTYGVYAKWLDHLAIDHNVHFVKTSGNYPSNGVPSFGMSYNAIVVGNLDDKNTTDLGDDELCNSSSYNINSNVAYKPDLCAPGTNINSAFGQKTGTSFSAPHVTGAVALLCEAKPILKLKQDVVKAILTAAVNPNSQYKYVPSSWSSNPSVDSYAKFGAGLLDVFTSVKSAKQNCYCYGSINQNQSQTTFSVNFTAGKPVRVSLAYLKNNSIITGAHYPNANVVSDVQLTDLDLYITNPNGGTVAQSLTSKNNVEIVEFTPSQTGTYTIKVINFSQSLPQETQFGLCWVQ